MVFGGWVDLIPIIPSWLEVEVPGKHIKMFVFHLSVTGDIPVPSTPEILQFVLSKNKDILLHNHNCQNQDI